MKWLEELKEGDEVYFTGGGYHNYNRVGPRKVKIIKVTQTQVTILWDGRKRRFSKSWGNEMGYSGDWHPPFLSEIKGAT